MKEVMKAHREQVKEAMYADATPDIEMGEVTTTDMVNTTPMTSGKRTRGTDAHFWIPKNQHRGESVLGRARGNRGT